MTVLTTTFCPLCVGGKKCPNCPGPCCFCGGSGFVRTEYDPEQEGYREIPWKRGE